MAVSKVDLKRRDEVLNRLKIIWNVMSSEERSAVEVVINSIIQSHAANNIDWAAYKPLTEAELFERIDMSLEQADNGLYVDVDAFEKALETEFGLT